MSRRPLHFITRDKEWELIQQLLTIVDSSQFHPQTTTVIMASPDYSATVAMHLAHAWSRDGDMLPIVPVDVTYPDETSESYEIKFRNQLADLAKHKQLPLHWVCIEAGIIRGGNWKWILEVLEEFGYSRSDVTLVALCENVHSAVKSDYVGEYYNNDREELMFYFERFNRHWPVS
jgi:hypothetical protein